VLRDGEPVIEVRRSFLSHVVSPDYENAFRAVNKPDDVFELNDASPVGVLQDKELNRRDKYAKPQSPFSAFRLGPLPPNSGHACGYVVRLIPRVAVCISMDIFIVHGVVSDWSPPAKLQVQ